MFDNQMRSLKEQIFIPFAGPFRRLPTWLLSVIGLLLGIMAAVALARQAYAWGFVLWFLNRVFDGLDGTVARLNGTQNDFGGYLDILIDFVVYAIIPIGLALGHMSIPLLISLSALLAVYYVNAASWMYLSAILEKQANRQQAQQMTSVTMPAGIIGGTETIIFYTLFILFPGWLFWLFNLMALLLLLTVGQRLFWAKRHLQ